MEQERMAVCVTTGGSSSRSSTFLWSSNTALLIYMALATVIVHAIVGNRYGFHSDELAVLDDARHLAWGYPAYPPLTPFFGRISLTLFGTSLVGFRFFATLAHAIPIILAGLMARVMGGKRGAQLVAAAAVLPFSIGGGALMQYVSFDYLSWVLVTYFVVRLLNSGDPRWWLAVGTAIGFGMLSKYTMGFLVLAMVASLLLTDVRRYLRSKWLWIGVALSILLFLPNLLWQAQHQFVSLDFLRYIHARDVQQGRTRSFIFDQLEFPYFPLVVGGLYFYMFSHRGKPFRMMGWTYVVTLLLFVLAKGRGYYLFPVYPMLFAAGAVWGEGLLAMLPRQMAMTIWNITRWVLVAGAMLSIIFFLPIAPVNSHWWKISNDLQETYPSEIGWPELVQEAARIHDALTPAEQAHLGILATTYGESGAINLFGPRYGLPRAISGINSFWQRGYGDPAPQTLIVIGMSRESADDHFTACRLAGHIWNQYAVKNEETVRAPDIFVCGPPKLGWPEFWSGFRYFG